MGGRAARLDGSGTTVLESDGLRIYLFRCAPELAPYITVYYYTEVRGSEVIEDWLPPEWANLRVGRGAVYEAAVAGGEMCSIPLTILNGPTSRATRLRMARHSVWGVGLLPLGFGKFVGLPAHRFADRFDDLALLPALAPLRSLLEEVDANSNDHEGNVARFDHAFLSMLDKPLASADAIVKAHEAIVADATQSVGALAAMMDMSVRRLERLCRRHFGFAPKLLLRRQRFLRSLARFMADPSLRWIGSLDAHYHDQAHFIRDFRAFMGMRPSEYASIEHPIVNSALRARRQALGAAMQILHEPADPLQLRGRGS